MNEKHLLFHNVNILLLVSEKMSPALIEGQTDENRLKSTTTFVRS